MFFLGIGYCAKNRAFTLLFSKEGKIYAVMLHLIATLLNIYRYSTKNVALPWPSNYWKLLSLLQFRLYFLLMTPHPFMTYHGEYFTPFLYLDLRWYSMPQNYTRLILVTPIQA